MGHLVVHVLAETQLVFGHANSGQVEVDSSNEVSQDGVINHSLEREETTSDSSTSDTLAFN